MGIATNNAAEYRGAILGLKYALEKGFKHIRVQGDSKLVCMQVASLSQFHVTLEITLILNHAVGVLICFFFGWCFYFLFFFLLG